MQENAQFLFLKSYAFILRVPKKAFCLLGFLGFCVVLSPLLAREDPGTRLYQQEAYSEARSFYEKRLQDAPKSPYVHYNLGCVAYQEGDYLQAQKTFEAALHTTDPVLQAKAFYNLGNAHFQQASTPDLPASTAIRPLAEPRILVSGQEKINEEPECTQAYMRIPSLFLTNPESKRQWLCKRSIESVEKAITAYTNSLSLDPENPKAKANLALAQKELDRMQEQEKARQDSASPAQKPPKEPETPKEAQDYQANNKESEQAQDKEEPIDPSTSQEKGEQNTPLNHPDGDNHSATSPPPTHPAEASSSPGPEARDKEESRRQTSLQEAAEPSAEEQRLEAILEASKKQEKKLHLQHLGSGGAISRHKQTLKDW